MNSFATACYMELPGSNPKSCLMKNFWLNLIKEDLEKMRVLASKDIKIARQYERLTGESAAEWRELTREDYK